MQTIEIEGPEAVLLLTLLGPFSDALAEQLAVATRLVHKLSRATTTTTTRP